MVGEPVEQSGGHLGVAEYGRPLAEGQVRRDDDGRPLVEPADEVEEELAARLGKWEIAQFVHDDEVEPGDEVGQPSLFAATCLRLEPIDEVDDVEEAAACAIADQSTSKGDGQVRLSRAGSADQNDIVLLGEEGPGCELAHQAFVDRRVGEVEVVDVLGQRQLGDGDLVFDGARLLLGDLRLKQVTDDARRFVLSLDAGGHDLVIGATHAEQLQRAHHVEDLGSFHISLPSSGCRNGRSRPEAHGSGEAHRGWKGWRPAADHACGPEC